MNFAQDEKVLRIDETLFPNRSTNKKEYMDSVNNALENTGIFHFFERLSGVNTRVPATISYYLDNQIISSEIDNMAELIKSLHGNRMRGRSLAFASAPLEIYGTSLDLSEAKIRSAYVSFRLRTNIWFPTVVDHLVMGEQIEFCDNSELADAHTPRLNNFLKKSSELTRKFGGSWDVVPGAKLAIYTSLLKESGIEI